MGSNGIYWDSIGFNFIKWVLMGYVINDVKL
jgi:hypothetical protein